MGRGGRNGAIVAILALLLGLAAAALSFIAYAKRIKHADVTIDKQGICAYPSSPSFAIGIIAAILISIHQLLISSGLGCFCCGRDKLHCNICGIVSLILFVLSWLSFVITFIGLIYTALVNNKSFLRSHQDTFSDKSTFTTKDGCLIGQENLFLGTAIWCVITLFFGLTSYAAFKCGAKRHRDHAKSRPNFGAV